MEVRFCKYCGSEHHDHEWPRECLVCGMVMYQNPKPVANLIIPIRERGIVLIRRGIEPCVGGLALPGGYMEIRETWQEAACREVYEEIGVSILPSDVRLFDVVTPTSHHNTLLLFGVCPTMDQFDPRLTSEVQEIVITPQWVDLCFPTHNTVLTRWFDNHMY